MNAQEIFLSANALCLTFIGLAYLASPNFLLKFYKLEAKSAGMDNMLSSAYGGLSIGLAALLGLGAYDPARTADALIFTGLIMSGFALGRISSLIRRGSPGALINGLLAFEIVDTGLAVALYFQAFA